MKKLCKIPMLLALVLTGCSSSTNLPAETEPPSSNAETEAQTAPSVRTLPVLSLQTLKSGRDSLEFATRPVTRFVAEDIKSWTRGYVLPPEPWYEACSVTFTETDGAPLLSAPADVKVRGNWTTTYPKKPLRVKFAEKQCFPGLHGEKAFKNWLLLAEYKDGSMLRNKTALSIAKELMEPDGLYTADAELVEVEINGAYWGIYLLTDMQQVNPDRVAVTEPEEHYTGTDIGYFMEFDGYYEHEQPLQSFLVDYADNAPLIPYDGTESGAAPICPLNTGDEDDQTKNVGISIKSDIWSQAQHDFIASFMNNVYRILYAAAYENKALVLDRQTMTLTESEELTPQEAVEAVVDVRSLADIYILSELTCDADIYWSSFFMDVDFGKNGDGRLRFEAPWDFDSAMGNKDRCADGQGFYASNTLTDVNDIYETVNPWLAVLAHEDWFQEIVRSKWTKAYDNGVFGRAITQIHKDAETHTEAFARNYERWDNLRHSEAVNELTRKAATCRTQAEAAGYLADWLEKRVVFLNEQWHN